MSVQSLPDLEALREFAKDFGSSLVPGTILRLTGPMGAGKTTFTRFLLESLGVKNAASPTYALHHAYAGGGRFTHVDHWDLYRVKDESELDVAGFWELLDEGLGLTIIEWPEMIPMPYFPRGREVLTLDFLPEPRGVKVLPREGEGQ